MSTNPERQIRCPSIFKKINALASFQICKQYRCVFGYHVEFATIRIAKKILGERLFLITDAVTENLNT
jgi:hypothetical protein